MSSFIRYPSQSKHGFLAGILLLVVVIGIIITLVLLLGKPAMVRKQGFDTAISPHSMASQCGDFLSSIDSPLAQYPELMIAEMGDSAIDGMHSTEDECLHYWSNTYLQQSIMNLTGSGSAYP